MKKPLIAPAIFALFTVSCGPGTKLEQAELQNVTLKNEVANLTDKNAQLNNQVSALNQKAVDYKTERDDCKNNLKEVSASRAIATSRFNELSNCLEEQSDSLLQIKRKAIKELSSFDNSFIKVKYQNGMVYISMQDQFMFPSGSTKINPGGMKALAVIAQILSEYDHVTAIVVGNTDTSDVKRGFRDNWSLSTERSNAIVRYLINHYDVNPARLIAAGKSKFSPVATNDTPEGRAKNRRTDIIFNPDLNKLWLLSQKYP
jgi:chemotaxis protein MotB